MFTRLDHAKRYEKLILWKEYSITEYPTCDNFNATNVDTVTEIPVNYDGIIGVPITFMQSYNPDNLKLLYMAVVVSV